TLGMCYTFHSLKLLAAVGRRKNDLGGDVFHQPALRVYVESVFHVGHAFFWSKRRSSETGFLILQMASKRRIMYMESFLARDWASADGSYRESKCSSIDVGLC